MRCLVLPCLVAPAVSYAVQHEDVSVGGYVCGEYQTARVYFPDVTGQFPLVVFAHGYNNPGKKAYECYEQMNSDITASGYVVIVPESSRFPRECATLWQDLARSIEWARSAAAISSRIDFSKKVGLLGHSMGGGNAYHVAGQADMVQDLNIGTAVLLHPQVADGFLPTTNSQVPIFFGTGSEDTAISPDTVKAAYSLTSGVPRAFSELAGATHYEPQTNCNGWTGAGHRRHTPFAVAMFDCHLKAMTEQCDKIYGDMDGALCSGSVEMTDCEHADEPQAEVAVV